MPKSIKDALGGVPFSNANSPVLSELAAAIEYAVSTNQIVRGSWSDLTATPGAIEGQGGEVLAADTGSHQQATASGYDGGAVDNAGRYSWNVTWGRWVRIGDNDLSGMATAAQGAKADTALQEGAEISKLAETAAAKVMTADERAKLLSIAPNATLNETDANLKDRANHTGAQAISTVAGLQSALDAKATAVQGNKADTALQPGIDVTNLSETADAKIMTGDERIKLAAMPENITARDHGRFELGGEFSEAVDGLPEVLADLDIGEFSSSTDTGRVLRVTGTQAAQSIFSKVAYRITPGRVYRVKFRGKRVVDSVDPNDDAVSVRLRSLNHDYAVVNGGTLADINMTVAGGVVEYSATLSMESGYDYVIPSNTVYARLEIALYGTGPVTDLEYLLLVDVTEELAQDEQIAQAALAADAVTEQQLALKADLTDVDALREVAIAVARQEQDGVIPERPIAKVVHWHCWGDPTKSMDKRYDSWFLLVQPDLATMPTPSDITTFKLTPLGGNEISFTLNADIEITPALLSLDAKPDGANGWQNLPISEIGESATITGFNTGYNTLRIAYVNAAGRGDYAFMDVMSQDQNWYDDFGYEMSAAELGNRSGYVQADGEMSWTPADADGKGGYYASRANTQGTHRFAPDVDLVGRVEGFVKMDVLYDENGDGNAQVRLGIGRIMSDGEWFQLSGRNWTYFNDFNAQATGVLAYDPQSIAFWYSPTQIKVILDGTDEVYSAALWYTDYANYGPMFGINRGSGTSDHPEYRITDIWWEDQTWT